MSRRLNLHLYCIVLFYCGLAGVVSTVPAAAQTLQPATGDKPAPFAYAAPALIKELDEKFPFPPPVPPSPPRYGGVLHVPTGALRAIDPTTVGYGTEVALVFDTLTEWETMWYFPEIQTTPVIRKTLAESWDMVDPSTWDFRLRQGVKFHNLPPVHGREMTAEDVKYSYDLLKDKPGYANRGILIKDVEVRDKYTVRFHLKSPDPNYHLNSVNSFSPVIVPREAVEAPGGLAKHPVGTGAFMLSGEGRHNLENAPFLAIFPGLAISVVVLAFNMLGDALRDLLDPRLRSR
jgi:ABC-type transport system substrate-binding protein